LSTILRVIELLKPMGVPEHPPAVGRVGIDIVGELATEHRKQAVGISDCAADRRRVGTVGDVELRGDQLLGQGETGVPGTRKSPQYV
jgi:hypothetical protein